MRGRAGPQQKEEWPQLGAREAGQWGPHPDVLLLADGEVGVQVHDLWRPIHGRCVPRDLQRAQPVRGPLWLALQLLPTLPWSSHLIKLSYSLWEMLSQKLLGESSGEQGDYLVAYPPVSCSVCTDPQDRHRGLSTPSPWGPEWPGVQLLGTASGPEP